MWVKIQRIRMRGEVSNSMSKRSTAQPSLSRLRGEREEVGGEGGVGGVGSERREVGGQARGGEAEGREGRAESPVQGGGAQRRYFQFRRLA